MKIHYPNITGSAIAQNGFTGSLQGTASWANNTTNALTASIALNALGSFVTSSWTGSASSLFAGTASFVTGAIFTNTNRALTASHALTVAQSGVAVASEPNGYGIYSTSPLNSGIPTAADNFWIGGTAGLSSTGTTNTNFLGYGAGSEAANVNHINCLGRLAGYQAPGAVNSNFLGQSAGLSATNASNSNFLGNTAGRIATNANNSNFLGQNAGNAATNANNSNFLGQSAGQNANGANNSNFLGFNAGNSAASAQYSHMLGYYSGFNATNASYSTLIGWQAGAARTTALSIGTNNIIIGNAISLDRQRRDAINIGGLIFGTGSYFNTSILPGATFSGSANGRIGINVVNPAYSLDVSGSGNYTNGLIVTGSFTVISGSLVELQVLNTGVKIGSAPSDTHTVTGSLNITGSVTITSGSVTMPNRPAFRVVGVNSNDIIATTILSGSAVTVDYNQGNNYNNTTGLFTAPIAGLYQVFFNGRVGSVNSQMQVIIYKNSNITQLMWEAPGIAASTHFGVSGIVRLAVNDTLQASVTVGRIQFDGNDSWGVTYIG